MRRDEQFHQRPRRRGQPAAACEVTLCASVNAVTTASRASDWKQQQPEQEQRVIVPSRDMVRAQLKNGHA
jgi:hypothetical protein